MFLTKLNFVPIDIIQSICFTVFAICYVNADYLLFVDCVQHWFKSGRPAEFVFAVSSKLGQTAEARYTALEIFDRSHDYVLVS